MRMMSTQSIYGFGSDKLPEEQWIELRKQAKRQRIASNAAVSAASLDMEIRVELIHRFEAGVPVPLRPPIWRELRLSGATNLGVLHDKILSPVMGWTRNYHGYFYTDYSDGSLWAPIGKSDAIDMMHVQMQVIDALDPFETALYQIISEGGRLGYTYDLGDQFKHLITCTKVFSRAESTGRVTVVGGAMRCPNEDGNGNSSYQEHVLDKLHDPSALAAACRERSRSMNCTNGRFDPYEFDVAECQAALDEVLGSKASSRSGSKKFAHQFGGFPSADLFAPGPGQKAAPSVAGMEGLVESLNVRPDRKKERLCAACGSPHNLSACAKCKSTFYCGKPCQAKDWGAHKRICKTLAEERAAFKQTKKSACSS